MAIWFADSGVVLANKSVWLKNINLETKISQGPIECSFIISDDERELNEFTQIYTIGEIFESDCMNDDIQVIGSVVKYILYDRNWMSEQKESLANPFVSNHQKTYQ